MLKADSCFRIGYSHKVCQDYSSHYNDKNPFVIISDGCSSTKDSDFGSRILTKLSEKSLIETGSVDFLDLIKSANKLIESLNLKADCLCATLVYCILKDGSFKVQGIGDYTIFAQKKNGYNRIISYDFPSGAPYYLKYELDESNKNIYFERFGKTVIRTEYLNSSKISEDNFEINQINFEDIFPETEYSFVSILSDGIKSFVKTVITDTSKYSTEVKFLEILSELMSYKIYGNDFVLKRTTKAFQLFKRNGIENYDDISIGTISNL